MSPLNKESANLVKLANVILWIMLIIGSILILKFFGNLIKPLVIALIIWYLIRIIKNVIGLIRIGSFSIPGWLQTLLSLIFIFFVLYSVISIIAVNLQQIAIRIDQYEVRQHGILDQIVRYLGFEDLADDMKDLPSSKELRPYLTTLVNSLTSALGSTFLIIIYLIFILIEEIIFKKKMNMIYK